MTTTGTRLTKFAVRTADQAWIKRNLASTDAGGWAVVNVPDAEVGKITTCGRAFLIHTFTDVPADALSATMRCLASWVETPQVTARRPEALSGRELFLAKARAAGIVR